MQKNTRFLLIIIGLFSLGYLIYTIQYTRLVSDIMLRLNPPTYAPAGYTVTQDRHKSTIDGGVVYSTKMTKDDKEIGVVEQINTPYDIATCNGPKKTILSLEICYYQRAGSDPKFKNILYAREGQFYSIRTNDDLSDADLAKIISNL